MKLFSLIALTVLLCGQAHASHFRGLHGKGSKGKGGKGGSSKGSKGGSGKGKGGKGKGGKGKGDTTSVSSSESPSASPSAAPTAFDCTDACFRMTDLITSTSIRVEAVETAQDVSAFYGYSSVTHASFNGPVTTVTDESMIMMHKDTTKGDDCDVSVVIVHDDAAGPDATGPNAYANLTLSGDLHNAVIRDDPGERYVYNAGADATTVSWIWAPCCTDGLAHTYTLGAGECITVTPDFVRGVDSWVFVSGPDPVGATRNGLNMENPIEICRVACAP